MWRKHWSSISDLFWQQLHLTLNFKNLIWHIQLPWYFFHSEESFALKRPAQDRTLTMSSKFVLGVSLFADGMPRIADKPPTPSERGHHPIPETPQPQRSKETLPPTKSMTPTNTLWTNPQRRKNLGSRVALLPGKFLRIRKVFAHITEKPDKLSGSF